MYIYIYTYTWKNNILHLALYLRSTSTPTSTYIRLIFNCSKMWKQTTSIQPLQNALLIFFISCTYGLLICLVYLSHDFSILRGNTMQNTLEFMLLHLLREIHNEYPNKPISEILLLRKKHNNKTLLPFHLSGFHWSIINFTF